MRVVLALPSKDKQVLGSRGVSRANRQHAAHRFSQGAAGQRARLAACSESSGVVSREAEEGAPGSKLPAC